MAEQRAEGSGGVLLGVSLVALFAGYMLGMSGVLASSAKGTPEERVFNALKSAEPHLSAGEWRQVRSDVASVEEELDHFAAPIFELVAELHGLKNGGKTDWGRAQSLCVGLSWTRCDRDELEEIKRRSRP